MILNEWLNNSLFGLFVVKMDGKIVYANETSRHLLNIDSSTIEKESIKTVLPSSNIITVIKHEKIYSSIHETTTGRLFLIEIPDKDKGFILLFKEDDYQNFVDLSEEITNLTRDLNALMTLSGELVSIIDGQGNFLKVNEAYLRLMGVKEHELVGRSVFSLQDEGTFSLSSAAQVMEKKKMVTITQTTKSGKRLIVRGHPIFNKDGQIEKVINVARDVTEEDKLKNSLEETRKLVDYYQSELNNLKKSDSEIIVKSKHMEEVYDLASRIADVQATVLILGESGVGKEVLARKIHKLSSRNDQQFVKVNCGAIPETLIESELFGYAKGTFTGANREGKQGLIMAANKGTLFLDEIGELPLNLQVKLLQVLQDRQITPLGQTTSFDLDVRFITATNRDLEAMVNKETFRKDLFYRLNVVPITIPPLRERKEDIPFLVDYFLRQVNSQYNQIKTIDKEVMQLFITKKWEGNVRELQNIIERLVVTVPDNHIKLDHLPTEMLEVQFSASLTNNGSLKEQLLAYEKRILERMLQSSRTMNEASIKLGVDISTISRKAKRHGLDITKLKYNSNNEITFLYDNK
ncbi:PAS domain-containing protein [Peribacillus cavernae]|uniref:PAS domain-containing protein n=1 Tax=Peribacillus cavernae TaxID=1674310 RepID=A0A3S0TXW6_9BACI|nr:sigma 54-interacting transcriptional regulator [Peribacillus cavernae]MDQ0219860.1 PAS domain S-box-containing protein [Peribacillus cavernae]RUQ26648.1 PAS domain-containing protein [Peribacillus cavernae]